MWTKRRPTVHRLATLATRAGSRDETKHHLDEVEFRNACAKSSIFQSWQAKADAGDQDAKDKVRRYRHRAGEELYDVSQDWYEWYNLANEPELATVKAELKVKLTTWMQDQGDRGQQTELEARQHQGRNREKVERPKRQRRNN